MGSVNSSILKQGANKIHCVAGCITLIGGGVFEVKRKIPTFNLMSGFRTHRNLYLT